MATGISSGLQTTDQLLFTGRNRINAVTLLGDGVNAATISVYDNTSATGKVVAKIKLGASHPHSHHIMFENPVLCENGIYADVTGTGAEYIVFYGG